MVDKIIGGDKVFAIPQAVLAGRASSGCNTHGSNPKISVTNQTEIFVSEDGAAFASTTVGQFIVKYGLPCADEDNCLFGNDSDVALFKLMLAVQGGGFMRPGLTSPRPENKGIHVQLQAPGAFEGREYSALATGDEADFPF